MSLRQYYKPLLPDPKRITISACIYKKFFYNLEIVSDGYNRLKFIPYQNFMNGKKANYGTVIISENSFAPRGSRSIMGKVTTLSPIP